VLLPYPERWALKVTWSLVILSTQVQYGLAAMGEDTAEVWSKAAMDPNSPSESDIARIQFLIDFWWNLHNRMAYLDEEGLADDKWRDAFRYLTSDKVAASIWSDWTRPCTIWERLNISVPPRVRKCYERLEADP
jgi:hypothetical protein